LAIPDRADTAPDLLEQKEEQMQERDPTTDERYGCAVNKLLDDIAGINDRLECLYAEVDRLQTQLRRQYLEITEMRGAEEIVLALMSSAADFEAVRRAAKRGLRDYIQHTARGGVDGARHAAPAGAQR
jgi:hypothetical protein